MDYGIITYILIGVVSIILVDARKKAKNTRRLNKRNCKVCGIGIPDTEGDELIIDGEIVKPTNKYPWMVTLMEPEDRTKFCGGAIISNKFILSAAHCVKKSGNFVEQEGDRCKLADGTEDSCYKDSKDIVIGFLTNTFHVTKGSPVSEIIPHPGFQIANGLKNDIALLKLKKPIKCTKYASPICLPPTTIKVPKGTKFAVTGWGSPDPGEETETHELMEARIEVESPRKCYFLDFFRDVKKKAWCLSGKGKQGPCFGDSGGPMFNKHGKKFFTLGVASAHSSSVCDTKAAVVYTMVQPYLKWIKKITGVTSTRP